MELKYEHVKEIVRPNGDRELIEGFVEYLNKHDLTYGINTPNRLAHFIAQCAHESGHFNTMEEYASGAAYEGRDDLGNTQRGDGRRYKGRGYIQITGRANYHKFGRLIGYDIEASPELAEDTEVATLIALAYWQDRKLNSLADADNVKAITKRINGGYNGLEDRIKYLRKAKHIIKAQNITFGDPTTQGELVFVDLKLGSRGALVFELQEKLVEAGYELKPDGAFGPKTMETVEQLQSDLDMEVTGIVNKDLWDILQEGVEDVE